MMRQTTFRRVLALSGWVALAATALPAEAEVLRAVVTIAFLLVCPGAAAMRLSRPTRAHPASSRYGLETLEACVLSVAFSVVICTVVAEAFFFTRTFTTARAVAVLALLTTLLAAVPAHGLPRRPSPDGTDGAAHRRESLP